MPLLHLANVFATSCCSCGYSAMRGLAVAFPAARLSAVASAAASLSFCGAPLYGAACSGLRQPLLQLPAQRRTPALSLPLQQPHGGSSRQLAPPLAPLARRDPLALQRLRRLAEPGIATVTGAGDAAVPTSRGSVATVSGVATV